MKKLLLSAFLLAGLSQGLFAQFGKGAMAITGIIGMSGNSTNITQTNTPNPSNFDQKTRAYLFVPSFSYFVTNRIEAGIALAFSRSTTESDFHPQGINPNATRTTEVVNPLNGFGVLANYYLKNEARYAWYAGLQFAMGSGTGKSTTTQVDNDFTTVETKNNGSTFGLNTGFLYFVNSRLALNANFGLLSFNGTKSETTNNGVTTTTKNSGWDLGVSGVIINIGLKYFLKTNAVPAP